MVGWVLNPKSPSQLLLPASLHAGCITGQACGALPFLHHLMTQPPTTWAPNCHLDQRPYFPAAARPETMLTISRCFTSIPGATHNLCFDVCHIACFSDSTCATDQPLAVNLKHAFLASAASDMN